MKQMRFTLLALVALTAMACAESSFNSGEGKKAPAAPKTVNTPPAPAPQAADGTNSGTSDPLPPGVPPSVPAGTKPCTDAGITQVRLLTVSAYNNAANQTLRYEVSLVDCDGKPKPIPQAPLLFDIDSQSMDITQREVPYTIENSQKQVVTSGNTSVVSGSDLFGNQEASRFHWKADNLQIPATDYKFYFVADVSNRNMTEFGVILPPTSGEVQFDTYLRIGDAQPVQQKIKWIYSK